MTAAHDIKTMQLYTHVERVQRELAELGLAPDAMLSPELLEPLDQLHYGGCAAVDAAIEPLALDADSRVLEIGSGLGGPARRLAAETGCRVTALELQPDLNQCASDLTRRCGLGDQVEHVCGDALDIEPAGAPFDAVVSWLTFLHIPERDRLLNRCRRWLRPGGKLFIEDFHARRAFDESERRALAEDVYCRDLPAADGYRDQLRAAGFESVAFDDRTGEWTAFVAERERRFAADAARFRRLHGDAAFEALAHFYATMRRLFAGGGLGGARIVASG